jgi:hypothetical protein
MIYFRTKYGDQYHVNEKAEIIRLDQKDFKPSQDWQLLGLRHVKTTTMFIPFDSLKFWLSHNPTLLYKNGNPQYTIEDLDHGTRRTWGNTKFHGLVDIKVIE